jgi:hypothetical protein
MSNQENKTLIAKIEDLEAKVMTLHKALVAHLTITLKLIGQLDIEIDEQETEKTEETVNTGKLFIH